MSRATDRLEIIADYMENTKEPERAIRIRQAITEMNSLQATVDRLPKTADGVTITQDMVLYSAKDTMITADVVIHEFNGCSLYDTKEWYSTRKAAAEVGKNGG